MLDRFKEREIKDIDGDWFSTGLRQDQEGEWVRYIDIKPLIDASVKTLNENLHLCDGNVCTLKELKDAVKKIKPDWIDA